MKIERIFKEDSNLKLADIVNAILQQRIDNLIEEYYNLKQVNFVTSQKGDVS